MSGRSIKFTSTTDMFDHLAAVPATVAITGLVRQAEGDSETLHFSLHGCGNWIAVPGELVDRFEPLGKARCGDHQHDVVRLHLKRPDDGVGSVFADLLTHQQTASVSAGFHGPGMASFGEAGCPSGTHWDWKTGSCVPD